MCLEVLLDQSVNCIYAYFWDSVKEDRSCLEINIEGKSRVRRANSGSPDKWQLLTLM